MPRRAPHEPPHFAQANDEWQRVQLPERFPIRSYRHQGLKKESAIETELPPPREMGEREALLLRQAVSVFYFKVHSHA